MKKKLFFKVGSKAQCAHEQKKITSDRDRWILKIMSEDESIELKNLGNKSFKKKRKNRIKKKTFSHVEKVLFRKKKKSTYI